MSKCYVLVILMLYFTIRSIGTFARALLDGAKKPQISLRLGAAAASRDITLVRRRPDYHVVYLHGLCDVLCVVPCYGGSTSE